MSSETSGYMPAVDLAELIRSKNISLVEYVRALLARTTEAGAEDKRLRLRCGRSLNG
ncbi:hypothetical protein [Mesorhizobium sp.]|uniref:hypothetical protein n=1 Tax=Mesorhizobium sp. TaxID=1871066 RepID=UPI0025BDDE09|nr:hypothetical protein [Mesorhizobium sp.]